MLMIKLYLRNFSFMILLDSLLDCLMFPDFCSMRPKFKWLILPNALNEELLLILSRYLIDLKKDEVFSGNLNEIKCELFRQREKEGSR